MAAAVSTSHELDRNVPGEGGGVGKGEKVSWCYGEDVVLRV